MRLGGEGVPFSCCGRIVLPFSNSFNYFNLIKDNLIRAVQ